MENTVVSLRRVDTKEVVDLSLPLDIPIGRLTPILSEMLGWQASQAAAPVDCDKVVFFLEQTGQKINPHETLNTANVMAGDCLIVDLGVNNNHAGADIPYFGSPAPGFATIDGRFFEIQYNRSLLGRSDSAAGLFSQEFVVDLNGIDKKMVSSRKHAQLKKINGKYYLQDLNSKHGTLLNGTALQAGDRVELNDGDIIELGTGGIKLRFQVGKKD